VAKAISVYLDKDAQWALQRLEGAGLNHSEAIRRALIESAARLGQRKAVQAEAEALEADPGDRAEILDVAGLMASARQGAIEQID
jgi:hypothetical protein